MPTFDELLTQVTELLQRQGRVSYRALKRRFDLDDEYLEDLKAELIQAQRLAVDEDGAVLVWTGAAPVPSSTVLVASSDADNEQRATSTIPAVSQDSGLSTQHSISPTPNPQSPVSYTPTHLAERILAEQADLERRGVTEGERKTITALFADLKGSTALIEGLDPEEARALIDPALQIMMDAVHRYEGYVAQALGDGIFALFGAPIAHEDHPHRALYAALGMQEAMRQYSNQLRLKGGVPLYLRVGVNTGEVVVRSIRKEDLHTDYVPVGHATNLAARMEQMAMPGSILVTADTHKLTDGYFAFKALGAAEIKGVEEPLPIYELLGAGPLRTRLQVVARRGLTRFVGRQSELDQLRLALDQAKAGHGQIVGVTGEPGLGKSRLFYEFKLTSQHGCLVLETYSVSYGKASPYLPLIELLKSYFQLQPQDDERTRREKVGGKVLMLDRSLEETLPYLFSLLGVDDVASSLQQMDAQIRRRRTFDAIRKLFLRESLNQPLILLFEDLHWIDSETQGFLDALSESVPSARILLLVNYRPEYRHDWGTKTYYTQLRLTPLGKDEAEELLTFLLGHETDLRKLKQLILEKTDGTPFFMEEVVQELREQGVLSFDVGAGLRPGSSSVGHVPLPRDLHIPTTVQGVLAARIDRLAADEKTLLQQLAVIGRDFPLSLLKRVVSQPEEELYRLLSSLQSKEFLYEQPAFPEVEYLFKHALTQEVAYGTVLQERRKALHERTAQAMETLYHDRLAEHYSELAHHYSRSKKTEKAVTYLHRAGQQAVQRSANTEAITHLTTALELLKTLPATPEHVQQELPLLLSLGPALLAAKGFTAPDVETTYSRARELCEQVGETSQLLSALLGIRTFHQLRGDLLKARELGEHILVLAQGTQDLTFLPDAYRALGTTLLWLGELVAARDHFDKGLQLYDPQRPTAYTFHTGVHPGVGCLHFSATLFWLLGYPEQALERRRRALTLARQLCHPFTETLALTGLAWHHLFCGDVQLAWEAAQTYMDLASEHGFPYWLALGHLTQDAVLIEQGHITEGLARLREDLADKRLGGTGTALTLYLAALAKAYGLNKQSKEGLKILADALEHVGKKGERWYEAELYRLKGELTLQQVQVTGSKYQVPPNPQAEAEGYFLQAIEVARRQQAKSLELRAATSLAQLWQSQGKKEEAHQLLTEIYGWFTEGFATKDLQEAKALLQELT